MNIRVSAVKIVKEFEVSRFLKFCLVGASGVLVNMFFLWLFYKKLGIFSLLSSFLAIQIAILNNFLWNDKWTWREKRKPGTGEFFIRLGKFALSSNLTSASANLLGVWIFLNLLGWNYLTSNLLGIGLGVVLNFLANHYWTYFSNDKTN
ncbi:MAG: GtrA family protein [candidate division Zixibacteria bacterium]|nr:GtrA family protein [candidate division Zixibacteria bacterium]